MRNMKVETDIMTFNFSKSDSTNSYALKTKLFSKNFRKFSEKESMFRCEIALFENFRSMV